MNERSPSIGIRAIRRPEARVRHEPSIAPVVTVFALILSPHVSLFFTGFEAEKCMISVEQSSVGM